MKLRSALMVVVAALAVSPHSALAGAYDQLTPEQQATVQSGGQVFITQDVSGKPWPKAFLYQRVDATPEEAAAVFADYELQSSYIPGLTKSKISRRVDAATAEVDYTLKSSFVTENYTVRDTVSSYDAGQSYKIAWALVRAETTKAIEGDVKFERLGTATLMVYYNFVVPGIPGAGLVQGRAMKQVRETAQAVAKQVEKERRNDRALLDRQLEILRTALRGGR
jgi:hypothetical protein